jgi:hypothetical protein
VIDAIDSLNAPATAQATARWLLAVARRVFADLPDRDSIVGKAHEGRGL